MAFLKPITALLLGLVPQGLVLPPQSYKIVQCTPEKFPVLTALPWLHVIDQHGMIVTTSQGAPLPTDVHFTNYGNLDLWLPITQFVPLGNNTWKLTTPVVIVPNLSSGPVAVQAVDSRNGVAAPRRFGYLE